MARAVNEKENAERRREILDAAQRMIYSKGYEAMSVQDLLDALKISKGAFYHYYGSKQALLEAWKTGQRDMLLSLMRSWYGEENLRVRLRANEMGRRAVSPLIARIVRQGVAEGVFDTPDTERAADMFMVLGFALSEAIVTELLLTPVQGPGDGAARLERVLSAAAAYAGFYERILGAPAGSIRLIDPELMRKWTAD